jgi:FixJ family two-component response regulator
MPIKKPVIAILEDDAFLLRALSRFFRGYGYDVETYASAAEYLAAFAASKAALLLMDMQLGDVSGLDIIRALRMADSKVPFICMSGSGDDLLKNVTLEAGAVAYMEKPFSMYLLTDIVRRIVRPVDRSEPCAMH